LKLFQGNKIIAGPCVCRFEEVKIICNLMLNLEAERERERERICARTHFVLYSFFFAIKNILVRFKQNVIYNYILYSVYTYSDIPI